jgi:hypothetical protein
MGNDTSYNPNRKPKALHVSMLKNMINVVTEV